jgi:hypothetical protein
MIPGSVLRGVLLAALIASPAGAFDPVFDDQSMHPQLLPRGSLEYEYALKRRERAGMPKPSADADQINEAMSNCDAIPTLSPATRERCEVRARQGAAAGKKPVN